MYTHTQQEIEHSIKISIDTESMSNETTDTHCIVFVLLRE